MLRISKIDETLIQLSCDDRGVLMELSEHFTFFAEGYKFHPKVKAKLWDGRIRLINLRNNTVAFGLLEEVIDFCKSRNYTFEIDPKILNTYTPSIKELTEFAASIPMSTRGTKIELRDYQLDGFITAIRRQRCLTISPTASGKSAMIYMMVRWYLENMPEDRMVMICVPSTQLVEQLKNDFIDYSQFDDSFDGKSEVHEIYSGKEKDLNNLQKYRIELENGKVVYLCGSDRVKLTNKSVKFVRDLKLTDDIDVKSLP